jgi:hypothetical protein
VLGQGYSIFPFLVADARADENSRKQFSIVQNVYRLKLEGITAAYT